MTHDEARLLAAGAALDDLEPDERWAFAVHEACCPDCLRLRNALGDVVAELTLSIPRRVPPPALLRAILHALH